MQSKKSFWFTAITAAIGLIYRAYASKWRRETAAMIEKLERAASRAEAVHFADFETLPTPVATYFRFALEDGQACVRVIKIRHEGQFCLDGKWLPFVSTQHFSARPEGFVWEAKMRMNPMVNVHVRDSFLGGRGAMAARIWSLFR